MRFSWKILLLMLPGLFCVSFFTVSQFSCQPGDFYSFKNASRAKNLPLVILWAWERPEDLEFINPDEFGVAFLAQTLILKNDDVIFRPRRQPLRVSPATKLIAVTRIESQKTTGERANLSASQQEKIVERFLKTLDLENVTAVQIDFDAAVSERDFYRSLLEDLRAKMPKDVPLSITALASFCLGDRWFRDLPVDEAVPMIFRMGADDRNVKNYLASGKDFAEPLCQTSYGIATDEPFDMKFAPARRIYVFNSRAWTENDVLSVREKINKKKAGN
jgi:hypothetical protein